MMICAQQVNQVIETTFAFVEVIGDVGREVGFYLRTMTSGRGQFTMEFEHYMPCPKNVAEEVIKEVKEREAAKK